MKSVPLSKGFCATVDDEDYQRVMQHKWHAKVVKRSDGSERVYAQRSVWKDGKQQTVKLHRFILESASGKEVDHINGNGLDNTRANLRLVSRRENMRNRMPQRFNDGVETRSSFKGVSWHSRNKAWRAQIGHEGKMIHLGNFPTEEAAAHAYDSAARELFGEFAKPNF